jgi:hypothetical protein
LRCGFAGPLIQAQPKFLSTPSSLFKSPKHLSKLAISLQKSLPSYLCRLGILKKKKRVLPPQRAGPKKLSSPLNLLKFPNPAPALAISLEKSLLSYLCRFAILKTDRQGQIRLGNAG